METEEITLSLDEELVQRVEAHAAKHGTSVEEIIKRAFERIVAEADEAP
ncbi:MAG: ribbon-helix-helix protein, CopG family [Acidobacteria bacterium]|nr:ribbon-helix-helix protein, CopG family [Acidobacteriota bacterium]